MTDAARHMFAASVGAVLTFGVFTLIAMSMNDGVFEYPLDDVYIHLAMSEQIASGGYGVNAGEYASAASSPIYPLFLLPFAGEEAQRWLPLIWNTVSLVVAAALVGWSLSRADLSKTGLAFAFVAAFCLNMYVTAYSGMENMAHGAASLAIVVGLWRFIETERLGALLVLGIFLAPLLRPEGLALALAACGVLVVRKRVTTGVVLGSLAVVPFAGFAWYLTSLGLDPLPSSVNAKLPVETSAAQDLLTEIGNNIRLNASVYGGRYLVGLTLIVLLVAMLCRQQGMKKEGLVGLAVVAASLAHLSVAAVGWLDRYENYLLVSLFAVLALMLGGFAHRTRVLLLSGALAAGVVTYAPQIDNRLAGMRAIHDQQGEMSRFAKEFLAAPVAVNDLGYVVWNNPNYVLDLYGLASSAALDRRLNNAPRGWGDDLADAQGVEVAMIYDRWVKDALGPDWVSMGDLVLVNHGFAFLGGDTVSFYARNQDVANAVQPALDDWARGLPDSSVFIEEPGATE